VKPYVKHGKKNDANDAAAICEAVGRPHMEFVPIKTEDQQAVLMLHRTREMLVGQRTMMINSLRAHMAELGVIAGQGYAAFKTLVAMVRGETDQGDDHDDDHEMPPLARKALTYLADQIDAVEYRIEALEKEIVAWHRTNQDSQRIAAIPQIGPITATAIVATVGDAARFASGRQFASWIGLVPGQNSTGGKQRLSGITKAGDRYLRTLLVLGATGALRYRKKAAGGEAWLTKLLSTKKPRLVSVALANKMARIVWKLLTSGESYKPVLPSAA